MDRNIQNVDRVRHETNLERINNLLSEGWIIITTAKNTYHDADVDEDRITYCLGHLIEETIEENWPPD